MFEAKVYRIAVSTLGAILQEEHIAIDTIQKWNAERAEEAGKLLLSVPEDASVAPDLYVVIVDSYVDATKVDKIIATGKPIVFFFSKYHDPKNSIQAEIDATVTYRTSVQGDYLCLDYSTTNEFEQALWYMFEKQEDEIIKQPNK